MRGGWAGGRACARLHTVPPKPSSQEFYADLRDAERDGEVNRILGAFKLNPYEQLGIRFDATYEDVRRAYRKVSLMVHPDKCRHPRSKDAFEIIGHAQKELLDEERRKVLDFLLGHAKGEERAGGEGARWATAGPRAAAGASPTAATRPPPLPRPPPTHPAAPTLAPGEVLKEYKKAAKHDAASRLAAVLNEEGREGLVAAYEATPEFHEAWKVKARDVMARAEWRRRKLTKRVSSTGGRGGRGGVEPAPPAAGRPRRPCVRCAPNQKRPALLPPLRASRRR